MSKLTISNPVNESEREDFNAVLPEGIDLVAALALVGAELMKRGINIKSPNSWLTIQVQTDGEYGEAFCVSEQE